MLFVETWGRSTMSPEPPGGPSAFPDRQAPSSLPAHVVVQSERARCARCGKSLTLSRGAMDRSAEIKAFATVHAHGDPA
jgi:hypothetical protein